MAVNHTAENNVVFQWDLKEVSGRLEIVSSVECGTNGIYFVEILNCKKFAQKLHYLDLLFRC